MNFHRKHGLLCELLPETQSIRLKKFHLNERPP